MYILIRPGPYVCGEWDFGGQPYWLLKDSNFITSIRQNTTSYINAITNYINQVAAIIHPYQITEDGTVIMLQVENEYGYYGTNNSLPV